MSASNGFSPIPHNAHTDYTTRYRCTYADDDYAIHTHGNGICVLTLAPTHPLRRLRKTVTSVTWQGVSTKALQVPDRSKAKVSGKRKKGAQYVHGRLVEVNDALSRHANLMASPSAGAGGEGFLALFQLHPRAKTMLSVDDRTEEGSEAERDHAERMTLVEPSAEELSGGSAAASTAQQAAVLKESQEAAQREGRSWQSTIEYLTPQQYLDKRKHFFVQTAEPAVQR